MHLREHDFIFFACLFTYIMLKLYSSLFVEVALYKIRCISLFDKYVW